MTEKKIVEFFSPVASRSAKRYKPSTSPQQPNMADNEKVGDLTRGQLREDLMSGLSILLDQKLASLATKEDVRNILLEINTLKEENKSLKEEVSYLKAQDKIVSLKLIDLEARSRRNNLIFRGIKIPVHTRDFVSLLQKFCMENFGTERNTLWINRAHPLDREGRAIIAHLPNDCDVEYIMTRAKHLKGTGVTVHRDFPREVRLKRAYLVAVRSEVERVAGKRHMPLVFDHLVISGTRFSWGDGQLMAGREDGAEKLQRMFNVNFKDFLEKLKQDIPRRWQLNSKEAGNIESQTTYAGKVREGAGVANSGSEGC